MDNKSSNKKIYNNLEIIWHNLTAFYTGVFGIAMLILVGVLGYHISQRQQAELQDKNTHYIDLLTQREVELASAKQELNYVRVELEVEKAAIKQVQADLLQVQRSYTELKKEITFYQNVMAPEMHAEGVVLENFIIEPTLNENRFRYKIVLVQTRKQKSHAKGYVKLKIAGQEAGQIKEIDISDLTSTDLTSTKFNFRYFQVLEGEFVLSADFQAERVFLSVIVPKTRWQKESRLETDFVWSPGVQHIE
ncbi:DUF6776 family protein [Algibacillus agarilyticus]|uniref:DUF6776 family protein n=1 Tax=Algibacillus agarilyticus TaxID=2234133 RepID=UPI000DD00344|nr:DUF6776 family protein [Algibacillus agarilyticus]